MDAIDTRCSSILYAFIQAFLHYFLCRKKRGLIKRNPRPYYLFWKVIVSLLRCLNTIIVVAKGINDSQPVLRNTQDNLLDTQCYLGNFLGLQPFMQAYNCMQDNLPNPQYYLDNYLASTIWDYNPSCRLIYNLASLATMLCAFILYTASKTKIFFVAILFTSRVNKSQKFIARNSSKKYVFLFRLKLKIFDRGLTSN